MMQFSVSILTELENIDGEVAMAQIDIVSTYKQGLGLVEYESFSEKIGRLNK